jgi:hypothetical protein
MTNRAREVLNDCRIALQMLEEETDLQRWRINWAAAVALIRSVGYVLDKVDGDDPVIRRVANAAFKKWKSDAPEHQIFREFIELERNNILKEYQFNVHPLEEVPVTVITKLQPVAGGEPIAVEQIVPIGDNIYRPLVDSYREGDDARDVLSEAIDWWEKELTAVDRLAKQPK